MSNFYIRVQNKITAIQIIKGSVSNEMVAPHIKKMWPKARIRNEGYSYIYIGFRLTKVQIQALKDYLEFVFN